MRAFPVLRPLLAALAACLALSPGRLPAKPGPAPATLTEEGARLEARYAERLAALTAEIRKSVPALDPAREAAFRDLLARSGKAVADEHAARKALVAIDDAKGLVEHAKGKWIGDAEKGIAQAEAALAKAGSEAEREAARNDLAKWQANKADGLKALAQRQAALDKLKADEPRLRAAGVAAKADLEKLRAEEAALAQALLAEAAPLLGSDRLDGKLAAAVALLEATPRGLAAYAQQGAEHAARVDRLLADERLLAEMLAAGGAKFGRWGRAMEILEAIRKASPRSADGPFRRLALGTALEHAEPVEQSNAADRPADPAFVDPVRRYLHYEQAFLAGELDRAFAGLGTWEYRMVVNCDAPDEILAWGRAMLRVYRPDYVALPDAGWRYVMAVRTDVVYGSQNVKNDLPSLHKYQNIPLNGGVCGRRAFFGRFILRAFGVPTWGVTQHKHAALSHWTPQGWVVNLGAGFHMSWWDKDEAPMNGSQFLLETQARARAADFPKALRARWVSRVLGEKPWNQQTRTVGGVWSNLDRHQCLVLAAAKPDLGPLGQELAEANEAPGAQRPSAPSGVTDEDRRVTSRDGVLSVPAVAGQRLAGQAHAMRSHGEGAQLHCLAGYKASYIFDVPAAGRYALTARVATLQSGQRLLLATAAGQPQAEVAVPHTVGLWRSTEPVEVALAAGRNTLQLEVKPGTRGVTLKELTLAPVR